MPVSAPSNGLRTTPYRTIFSLAWPQVLTMVLHFSIGFVDVWAAGQLSRDVQAGMGLVTQLYMFLLLVAMAGSNGAVAAISQSDGAGRTLRALRYIGLSLLIGLSAGLALAVLVIPSRPLLLQLIQTPDSLKPITAYFLTVFALTLPSQHLLIMTNSIFRARKMVMIPLATMLLVTSCNALGDLALGLGAFGAPKLGYQGLAWSTLCSVSAGAAFNLIVLRFRGMLGRFSLVPWRWIRRAAPYLIKVAWPDALNHLIWNSGYMVLFGVTANLPEHSVDALAAMAAGMRIESFFFLPAFGLNMTASILVGYYLGAGEPAEAKRYGWRILLIGVLFISVFTLALWRLAQPMAALMTKNPVVQEEVVRYLFWNFLALPCTVTTMILTGAFRGAGATLYNLIVVTIATWGVRVPLAWLLGRHILHSAEGVWIAMFCSMALQASLMVLAFATQNWQRFSMYNRKLNTQGLRHDPAVRTA
ncbi:MAG: MATE family efflux transporter [Desulfovibrionaceae bacterium]